MTMLVAWASVDTHGVAGLYLAADSQISFGESRRFDYGRKVFAFRTSPDIVGYCGDALFPSMVLAQLIDVADSGLLFDGPTSCKDRFEVFKEKLVQQCHRYPTDKIESGTFQVIFAARETSHCRRFFCHLIEWSSSSGWKGREVNMPARSEVLFSLGSGGSQFSERLEEYQNGPTRGTSRAVFHCFCDVLFSGTVPWCGGAPQLVGLYSKAGSAGKAFGVIRNKRRYLYGAEVDELPAYDSIEWRNDLFERCDGRTMRIIKGAKEQPNPQNDNGGSNSSAPH